MYTLWERIRSFANLWVCVEDPVVSACMGMVWCASRVAYTIGYCRRDKENGAGRTVGMPASFVEFALIIVSGLTGYQMVMG